jgi:hypothetical protein
MIYSNSRYADGTFIKAYDSRRGKSYTTVLRKQGNITSDFNFYEWEEGDRIDSIADKFSAKPGFWEDIMDINPEIINPYSIRVGTVIRIPSSFHLGK